MILYISGKRAALYLSTILRRKVTVLKLVITSLLLMYFDVQKTCPYFLERHNGFLKLPKHKKPHENFKKGYI